MKKLFVAIIPALLITFLVVYSSCNDVPVDGTSTENSQSDNSLSSVKEDNSQSNVLSTDGKDSRTGSDPGINITDAAPQCGVFIGPSPATVYIQQGTQYTYTYSASAAVVYSPTFTLRYLNILDNGNFVSVINNWTSGTCGSPAVTSWSNYGQGTISLGGGFHKISAHLRYSCVIGGQPVNIDDTVHTSVNVVVLTIPSTPYVSFSTIGQPPSRRPYLTWTASSPNVTGYVIQRRNYPNGEFQDFASVNGSTLSFTDNSITVVTHRYDLVYYNVEYRVRAVNQIGSSGYQAPSYEWYKHGCYSYTLGYICDIE
jgi:hypothetical protein